MSTLVNFTSITIAWQPLYCLQQNSLNISYTIHYTETFHNMTNPQSTTTTDTSFVATSLFPSTSYTFEIAAVNIHGTSQSSHYSALTKQPTGMLYKKIIVQ